MPAPADQTLPQFDTLGTPQDVDLVAGYQGDFGHWTALQIKTYVLAALGTLAYQNTPSWFSQTGATVLANIGGNFAGAVLSVSSDTILTYPLPARIECITNTSGISIQFPAFDLTKCTLGQSIEIVNAGNHSVIPKNSLGNQFASPINASQSGLFRISGVSPDALATIILGSISGLDYPLSIIYGGTGAITAAGALTNLGALPVGGGTLTGNLILNGDATQSLQPVTYQQFQGAIAGFTAKAPCRLYSANNLSATYNNGSSGVGATLILSSTGVLTIDGKTVALNDRICVNGQTNQIQNGIYYCSTAGAVGVAAVLTRSTDYDNSPAGEVSTGTYTNISDGNTYAGTFWYLTTTGTIIIGTSLIAFAENSLPILGAPLSLTAPNTVGIAPGAITYTYVQNVSATDKILGRQTAGAGTIEEISCTAAGRNLIAGADTTAQRTTLGLGNAALKTVTDNTKTNVASVNGSFTTGHLVVAADTAGTLQDGGAITQFLQSANNLSDVANASTARTNLGLAIGINVQAFNYFLSILSAFSTGTSGIISKNTNISASAVTLTSANNLLSISNGDGVSGNPTFTVNQANLSIATSQLTGTLGVTNGGTGTSTQFTAGSIVFAGASGVYSQDNTNLFWDSTNHQLKILSSSLIQPSGFTGGNAVSLVAGIQTTDATPTVIASVLLNELESITINGSVTGTNTTHSQAVGGTFCITARRATGGSVTIIGNPVVNVNSSSAATFTCSVNTGASLVTIVVTGVAATTYNWVTNYTYQKVLSNA